MIAVAVAVKEVGIVVAAGLAAVVVLAPASRVRGAAMLGALVLIPVLLLSDIWNNSQFEPVRNRPGLAAAGGAAALVAVGVAAFVFDRRPALLPLAAAAALPFRVPIESGGQTSNLLVPLYFVVAAGALAFAVPRLRGRRPARESPPRGALEWLLLGAVALYAVQASYSGDFSKALEQVVFFYVPFALLYALLLSVRWTVALARRCLYILVALALVFSAVGAVEYATRTILLNPDVVASNQFQSYFRVNSLFFDPNIYGRFLATVIVLLAAVMLWTARRRVVVLSGIAVALLFGGLVLTLSQSSFGALLVGLVVLAALRWSRGLDGGGGGRRRGGRRRGGVRLPRRGEGGPGQRQVGRQGDERPPRPGQGRRAAVRGPSAVRMGVGLLHEGVPRARARLERARRGRLAHDPRHDRRRAGRVRAPGLPGPARRRLPPAAARRGPCLARPRRDRRRLRRADAAHLALRRVPRGPADVGAAGGGDGVRAGAG